MKTERLTRVSERLQRLADVVGRYPGTLESMAEQQALWRLEEALHDCEINAVRLAHSR